MSDLQKKGSAKQTSEQQESALRLSLLATLCPPTEFLKPKTDLLGCIINTPQAKDILLRGKIAEAETTYATFSSERFKNNFAHANYAFDEYKTIAASIIRDARKLYPLNLDPNESLADEKRGMSFTLAAKLALRLHQDPNLRMQLSNLPSEAGGILPIWGKPSLPLKEIENRAEKEAQLSYASGVARGISDEIWKLLPNPINSNNSFTKVENYTQKKLYRQATIDRTEALNALHTEINFPNAIEMTALTLLRSVYPTAKLPDKDLGSYVLDLKYWSPKASDVNSLTLVEADRRTEEIGKRENLGKLPAPWLASLMLRAQFAASKQEGGSDRTEYWQEILKQIPDSTEKSAYNGQLKTLKEISALSLSVSQFKPSPDIDKYPFEFSLAEKALDSAIKARDLAASLPPGYERVSSLIVTSLQYVELAEKLKSSTGFKDNKKIADYPAIKKIADALITSDQVPNAVLQTLWKFLG